MKMKIFGLSVFLFSVMVAFAGIGGGADLNWKNKVSPKDLGGETRYMNYISTDKPIYRPGENVYLRAVVLSGENLPVDVENSKKGIVLGGYANFTIKNAKGENVKHLRGIIKDSVAGAVWNIPEGMAGGSYTVSVKCPSLGTPEAKREFDILSYRVARLKTDIEFERESYGPGDEVKAVLTVSRAEGGVPENAAITATATLDGKVVFQNKSSTLTKSGKCSVSFRLPEKIVKGDGVLNFVVKDGGTVESASKTIPIVLKNLKIEFYPESGDLISGVSNRVYFSATLVSLGKPGDISGKIYELDADGKIAGDAVASLRSVHEGRGVFSFKPVNGKRYALKISKPTGVDKLYKLPEVKNYGAVIQPEKKVFEFADKIKVGVRYPDNFKPGHIYLTKREKVLDSKEVSGESGATIEFDAKESEGVLIVTLTDDAGVPVAERLVFRKPRYKLNISLKADKKKYLPGEHVKLDVETTDGKGNPVEAVVGISVVDDAVLKMRDKRLVAPRLPVMVYLEPEVFKLEDASVYLDDKNEHAPEYLDLLLGTQGWRRFIILDYKAVKKKYEYNAMRAMAENIRQARIMRKFKGAPRGKGMPMDFALAMNDAEKLEAVPGKVKEAVQALPKMGLNDVDMDMAEDIMFMPKRRVAGVVAIREYAHKTSEERTAEERNDFTETVYWCAGVKTDSRNGKASVEFDLSDSITEFKVMADAFARNAALGSEDVYLKSVKPFYIEPKMPLVATIGDKVELPIAVVNGSDDELANVNILVRSKDITVTNPSPLNLKSGERARVYSELAFDKPGLFDLNISASGRGMVDTVVRKLKVLPKGYPANLSVGGMVDDKQSARFNFSIPEKLVPGSVKTEAVVYLSPLANMEDALNALLRSPHGCFEQASSTNYPVVMVRQYIDSHSGISRDIVEKADKLLKEGYKKLAKYECSKKGYEWFGKDPGHEALTAYGLMEFADMAKVMPIDKKMLKRTEEWLMSRRDGTGGFKLNKRALDSFGRAPVKMTNAYIVWSLLESGKEPASLKKEIDAVRESAEKSEDSYLLSLAANIMLIANDKESGTKFCRKLIDAVNKEGAVDGAETTITTSGGISKLVETTSLAIMAWLKLDGMFVENVEKSMKWLFKQCVSGSFGSTQSTVLALKAINAYDRKRSANTTPGSLQLLVDGNPFGGSVKFGKNDKRVLKLPDFASALLPGEHLVEIKMKDGTKKPFSINVSYNTDLPQNSDECKVAIITELSAKQIEEGREITMNVKVSVKDENAPTPIAVIGIPGGCEVRFDKLKELRSAGAIDSFELFDGRLVLYWRAIEADKSVDVPVSLTAAVPGEYTAPASCVYLYYTDEDKCWVPGTTIKITK